MTKFATTFSQWAPWAAGGAGLAALENQVVGKELPDPLKKINIGLGGLTGVLAANPETRPAALSSIPLKEMALFGIGSLDKFRRQQQSLVNTNLSTAKINEQTANITRGGLRGRNALLAAFLLPTLVGGGAMGYQALERHRKQKHAKPVDDTLFEKGEKPTRSRVRIEVPSSALPKDFLDTLAGSGAYTKVQGTGPRTTGLRKAAMQNDNQQSPSMLGLAGSFAKEMTGIPSLMRSVHEGGNAFGNLAGGNFGEAARYGAGALGSLGLGAINARYVALPLLGKLLGKARLGGVIGRAGGMIGRPGGLRGEIGRQFTEMPTFARPIFHSAYANELGPRFNSATGSMMSGAERMVARKAMGFKNNAGPLDRLRDMQFRYDPKKFDWENPTPATSASGMLFNRFLTSPTASGRVPMGLPGQLSNLERYGANRAINAGYWTKQLAGKHPGWTIPLVAGPAAGMGVLEDERRQAEDAESMKGWQPDYMKHQGPYGMPVSSVLSSLLGGVTGSSPMGPIQQQIRGPAMDPFNRQ